jgi:hypothetical protein
MVTLADVRKSHRWYVTHLEERGFEIREAQSNKHYKLKVTYKGRPATIILPNSPSDKNHPKIFARDTLHLINFLEGNGRDPRR